MACAQDLDCPGSQACYTNISWFDGASGNGCLCSTWYGWNGPNCTDYTSTTHWWLGSSIILVVISFACALLAIANGVRLVRVGRFSLLKDATTTANWQLLVALLCQGVDQSLIGLESLNPSLTANQTNGAHDKIADTQPAREFLLVVACGGTIIAAMTMALVWLEVAERASRLAHSANDTLIPRTRLAVTIFEVVVVVAMTVLAAILQATIGVAIGMLATLVLAIVYLIGFCKLRGELSRISSVAATEQNKELYGRIINEITWTLSGIFFGLIFILVMGVVILVEGFRNWKESCLPDTIPALVVAWQLLPTAVLITQIFLLNALRKATNRRVQQTKTSEHSANGQKRLGDEQQTSQRPNQADLTTSSPWTKEKSVAIAAYQVSTAE